MRDVLPESNDPGKPSAGGRWRTVPIAGILAVRCVEKRDGRGWFQL
jgi:hypothetical protein